MTRLEVRELRKSFGGNSVLRGVDLIFEPGQVHALLGPNGAGKSTTLGCITGAVIPDSGRILVGSTEHAFLTPRSARESGIAIIYQHPQLVGDLTVADNVFLGRELRRRGGVDTRAQGERARVVLESLGADLDVHVRVSDLALGEQQLVEIARALVDEPTVLILDEPTAALSEVETDRLLATMRRLTRNRGLVVVFVTHILREVLAVADVATIIRDGSVLWTQPIAELTLDDLVKGISPDAPKRTLRQRAASGPPLVELIGVASPFTGPLDLEIAPGEIVGFFGALGSGRTDLLESLAGVRHRRAGEVRIGGNLRAARSPRSATREGIAFVPSDRKAQAVLGEMTALENLLLPHFARLSPGLRRPRRERVLFNAAASSVRLSPDDPRQLGDYFSGGNAQKLMLSRWIGGAEPGNVDLLLLDDPTQGVDIGSRFEIYELLRRWVEARPRSVLFASNEPEELLTLADRVVVLVEGRVTAIRDTADVDESALIALAHANKP